MSTLATPPPDRVGLLHRGGQVAALDGVRALAVIAVVAHHLIDAARERGGYLGVSTFFTLSGFLITSLLVRDVEAGGVSLDQTISADLASIERGKVVEVLRRMHGNKTRAAKALGIDRRKLYRLVEKYNIQPNELQEAE